LSLINPDGAGEKKGTTGELTVQLHEREKKGIAQGTRLIFSSPS